MISHSAIGEALTRVHAFATKSQYSHRDTKNKFTAAMPLTRNQRNVKTSSPCPTDSAKVHDLSQATGTADSNGAPTHTPDLPNDRSRSPSPHAPRLRDRRSLAATKPFGTTVPSDYILNRQSLKRPASTTPPTRIIPKRQCELASSSFNQTSDQSDPTASLRIKSTESHQGVSLLQKPRKPDQTQAPGIIGNSSISERLVQYGGDGRRNDYTRAKSSAAEVAPIAVERAIQNVRASLSSQDTSNPKIDLNESACSPDKIRPPVRITLPSSSSKRYSLSSGLAKSAPSTKESRQIEIINFNSSMLRRNQSIGSNQCSRDEAINLTTSASAHEHIPKTVEKIFNVLIAVTGSVAAVKLLELIKKLKSMFPQTFANKVDGKTYKANIKIKIVLTKNSKHFLPTKQKMYETLNDMTIEIYDDIDEWSQWKSMGDPVLHIELRKWADIMVIAPLDANTMAKIASGICDNLVTCVVRAWDVSKKLLYCPAMNVHMYNHPITREQLCKLQSFGYLRIDCVEKRLACGDVGMGAMASVETIAEKVVENLLRPVSRPSLPDQTILNKQPTYPIMSTNIDTNNSAQKLLSSLHDKFGGPIQPGIHAQNVRSPLISNNNGRSATAGIFGQPHKTYSPSNNLVVTRKEINPNKSVNGSAQTSNPKINAHRPNFVTSLQNLRAINSNAAVSFDPSGNGTEDSNDDDNDEDIIDQSTPESCNSEWSYNGFDPTDVLEQSLITDDSSIANNGFGTSNGPSFQMNSSSVSGLNFDGLSRVDRTPFFNTTKFLNICFDKERNCYTCAMCKSDYKNRKSMARHLKEQHIQGNIFHCLPCGMSYKRREKLIKHNRERHGIDGISL